MVKEKQLILSKVETTYGVDASPVGATDAILAEVTDIEIVSRVVPRNNVKPYFGQLASVAVNDALRLSFTTEIKGSGTAGTKPEVSSLFRGCNYTETVVAATSVAYDPNSQTSTADSLTLYFYIDGQLYKLLGCRGTWELSAKAGEFGKIKWTFTGIYSTPTDTALATPTYSSIVPPRFLSASFAIDTYAAIIDSLTINGGNEVLPRNSVNAATGILEYFIGDRKVTGSIDPEAVLLAAKNFYTLQEAGTLVAFTATIGQTAGNKCTITGPKVQIEKIAFADRNRLRINPLTLNFTPNTGNDEIKILFV